MATQRKTGISEGSIVNITDPNSRGYIAVIYIDDSDSIIGNTDICDFTEIGLDQLLSDDLYKEYTVIENPFYLSIDGYNAETFTYNTKDKLENSATTFTDQEWNVVANNHWYIIGFGSPASLFESSEYTQIRDHFINSVKFPVKVK